MKKIVLSAFLCLSVVFCTVFSTFAEVSVDTQYAFSSEEVILYEDIDSVSVAYVLCPDTLYEVVACSDDWVLISVTSKICGYAELEDVNIVSSAIAPKRGYGYVDSISVGAAAAVELNTATEQEASSDMEECIDTIEEYVSDIEKACSVTASADEFLEDANEYLSKAEKLAESTFGGVDEQILALNTVEGYVQQVETLKEEAEGAAEEAEAKRQAIVDYACSFVGVLPYVWGGTSLTTGADCSGFVQAIYKAYGYSIPRNSWTIACCGTAVSYSDIKVGDIVCFNGHVGIYIGNDMFVHSPSTGQKVKISRLSTFPKSVTTIRRVIV